MAARRAVAVQLLDPLEVDRRNHADDQIGIARHVDVVGRHRAVQALVEEQIGLRRDVFPRRERSGRLPVRRRFGIVVEIFADSAGPGLAVGPEELLEFFEEVAVGTEVAEEASAALALRHLLAHLGAVVAVKRVTLDDRGRHALAPEDLLKDRLDGGRARTGRTGDREHGKLCGHGCAGFSLPTRRRGRASAC